MVMSMCELAYADDYREDPSPKLYLSQEPEPYQVARNPDVCSLYLKNLQYFLARRDNSWVDSGLLSGSSLVEKAV